MSAKPLKFWEKIGSNPQKSQISAHPITRLLVLNLSIHHFSLLTIIYLKSFKEVSCLPIS